MGLNQIRFIALSFLARNSPSFWPNVFAFVECTCKIGFGKYLRIAYMQK